MVLRIEITIKIISYFDNGVVCSTYFIFEGNGFSPYILIRYCAFAVEEQ